MIKTLLMNHMDMEHKWCKSGPKTPQNHIVHPMLVPVVSYFISYPAFKCLQYHPMPQTCVWTVIGDQNPTYEPYGRVPVSGGEGAGGGGAPAAQPPSRPATQPPSHPATQPPCHLATQLSSHIALGLALLHFASLPLCLCSQDYMMMMCLCSRYWYNFHAPTFVMFV